MYILSNNPQNFKHHTITETICSWQNHAPARARAKSSSAAMDNMKQAHIPHLGLKWKYILIIFLFYFKETKTPKFPKLSLYHIHKFRPLWLCEAVCVCVCMCVCVCVNVCMYVHTDHKSTLGVILQKLWAHFGGVGAKGNKGVSY